MKSRKGFTLVELLVTIVILGIITGISIPIIRNVQANMVEKKYTTYYDSMKSSAKLYNDSYNEDMFGHNKAGVYCISYEQLEEKNLIKDISVEDVTCNSKFKTFVRVTKLDDKYVYTPFLECVSKTDNTKVQKVLPNGNTTTIQDELCDSTDNSSIIINLEGNYVRYKGTDYDRKRRKAKIEIRSATGINNIIDVKYAWHKIGTSLENLNWTKIKLNVPSAGKQKEELLNSSLITTTSDEIITPEGGNGTFELLIKADNLKDLYGNSYSGDNPKIFKSYAVDNDPPTITELNIRSINDLYYDKNVKISFTGNDNFTNPNDLKMCITTDASKCKNKSDFKAKHNNSSIIGFQVSNTQDGVQRMVYVSLIDKAGNIKKVHKPYTVDKEYTVTLNNNGSTEAGDSKTTVIYHNNKFASIKKPKKVVSIKYVNTIGATVKNGDKSKEYSLNGWYTTASGGYKVASNDATPALQANVPNYTNANSQWTRTSGATVYAHWDPVTATLPTVTKKGHNCKWTTDNGASSVQSGGTWTFTSANDRTFTAVCTAKTVKVTFKKNNSAVSGTDNQTQTFTYGKSGQKFSPKGFSWAGHTQGKWAESSTGTGIYSIESGVSDDWINSHSPSITLYATWSTNSYTLTYSCSGDSNCNGKKITRSYGQAWGANCTPSKTGYNFNGWSGVPATATGNVTATCNMSKKTYTVTYKDSVGSGCNGKKVTKSYGEAWGTCTPSVAVTSCKSFGGWTGDCGSTATKNCTMTAVWNNAQNKWYTDNPGVALQSQRWFYCQNGSRISSGWHELPETVGGLKQQYYFENGYAWCNGWWKSSSTGYWYFLGNADLDGNGKLDCRMYHHESRQINGKWYEFDPNGVCIGPPGCTY